MSGSTAVNAAAAPPAQYGALGYGVRASRPRIAELCCLHTKTATTVIGARYRHVARLGPDNLICARRWLARTCDA